MRNILKSFFALAFLMSISFLGLSQPISPTADEEMARKVLFMMLDAVANFHQAEFELVSRERVNGEIDVHTAHVKMQYAPKKIFIQGLDENREIENEILFLEGENDNLALVSPNGFPYINLNLDPVGSTMRHHRHLTVLEAGGQFLGEMIKIGYAEAVKNNSYSSRFSADTSLYYKRFRVSKISIYNQDYGFYSYTVKKGETLRDICFKKGIPEQKVIDINENVDGFNDNLSGKIIRLPNYYAKRFEMLIHATEGYPIWVKTFDEHGLFEEYEYIYFNSAPTFTPSTFDADNPDYTF